MLLAGHKTATIERTQSLADGIGSKADVLVLVMNQSDFANVGQYVTGALKKRKTIGIAFGAAKLFGDAGLKISNGNCAWIRAANSNRE